MERDTIVVPRFHLPKLYTARAPSVGAVPYDRRGFSVAAACQCCNRTKERGNLAETYFATRLITVSVIRCFNSTYSLAYSHKATHH